MAAIAAGALWQRPVRALGSGAMATLLERYTSLPERHVETGEQILREGGRTGTLFILAEGAVEVVKSGVQVAIVSEPGAFFGELSLLLDAPHMASVIALAPSRFYVVENADAFLRSHPDVMLGVSRLLAKRLHLVTTYLVDLKKQFEASEDHLGMVDEVLESLLHHQDEED
jgi:CRP-like cAMP-binding protein